MAQQQLKVKNDFIRFKAETSGFSQSWRWCESDEGGHGLLRTRPGTGCE